MGLALFQRPVHEHQILLTGNLHPPARFGFPQDHIRYLPSMVDIQRIGQAQESREFEDNQTILLRQGLEIFILHRGRGPAVIADQISNNILFPQAQANETIGIEQIITMLVMINSVDEVPDIVEQGASLQQEQVIPVQVVKGFGLFKKAPSQFGGETGMLFIELIFTSQMQRRFPNLLPFLRFRASH